MNHNTRRSLEELFRCIERMKVAHSASLRAEANATEDEPRENYRAYRAMGAVEGQAAIVKIDLDIYEKEEVKA
jgi:hypothetical protein